MTVTVYKKCSLCRTNLPATTDFFYPENRRKDGLRSTCKSCYKAKQGEVGEDEGAELITKKVPCFRCGKKAFVQVAANYPAHRRLPPKLCCECIELGNGSLLD